MRNNEGSKLLVFSLVGNLVFGRLLDLAMKTHRFGEGAGRQSISGVTGYLWHFENNVRAAAFGRFINWLTRDSGHCQRAAVFYKAQINK